MATDLGNLYTHSMVHPDVAAVYVDDDPLTDLPKAILDNEVPNASVIANFDAEKFLITVNVTFGQEEYGSVTGGGEYNKGSKATIKATAAEGYRFVKWNDDDTNAQRQITVTEDATYTASFEVVPTHTITTDVTPEESGAVALSPEGGEYYEGSQVTLTATPAEGYQFTKWDDDETENPRTITVTEDATYTATFAAVDPGTEGE